MKPFVIGDATVTFRTTAVAPVAGTPPTPSTFNCVSVLRLSPERFPPVPSRVSRRRAGFRGTKKLRIGGSGRSIRTGPDEYDDPIDAPLCTTAYTQYVPLGIPLPSQLNVLTPGVTDFTEPTLVPFHTPSSVVTKMSAEPPELDRKL